MVSLRKGWQLAAAVLLAWALSNVLGLQGGWWAVMSALIIVRPGADSTLDAGWARARGAVLGSAVALLGAGLQAQGLHAVAVTLLVVGALAFWSAAAPGWRSAPITALIVLQASAMPGHSAWQVALLRIAEIGVGVVAGVLVTLPVARQGAAARFDARCAELLRLWADEFPATLVPRRTWKCRRHRPVANGTVRTQRPGSRRRSSGALASSLATQRADPGLTRDRCALDEPNLRRPGCAVAAGEPVARLQRGGGRRGLEGSGRGRVAGCFRRTAGQGPGRSCSTARTGLVAAHPAYRRSPFCIVVAMGRARRCLAGAGLGGAGQMAP